MSRCTPSRTSARAGQPLITLHTDTPERFARAREALADAYEISDAVPEGAPADPRRVD